jgi:hypothetical protein
MRPVELRIACYRFSKNPFFSFNSPSLETRSRLDKDVNCDVPAICGAILHSGLGANLELAFHLRVIVNEKLNGFSFLTIGDLKGEGGVPDGSDFPRLGWAVGGWERSIWDQPIRNRRRPGGNCKAYNKQRG